MIKVYLKQALQLLKQNKLYSSVYILGTGLAIGMIMTVAIIYFVKIAPFYPETNRDRMLGIRNLNVRYPKEEGMSASSLSYSFIREHLYTLKSAEQVTAILNTYDENNYVEHEQSGKPLPVAVKYTDANFWKVFGFEFVDGKPFSEEDFQSAIHTVVISDKLARTLFDTAEAAGRYITLDGDKYRVSGVVRSGTYATPLSYAQVWMPFSLRREEMLVVHSEGYLGLFSAYILAPSVSGKKQVKEEAADLFARINNSQDRYILDSVGQPEDLWKTAFRQAGNYAIDWWQVFSSFGIMLLALIFVPAVNLAGMVSSRMDRRLPEMGVRKAFGASNPTLLNQLLIENLLLTLFGGCAGLMISWFIVYSSKHWIFTLFENWSMLPPEGVDSFLSTSTLFHPGIFAIAFLVCLVLNIVSAIVPAWHGLGRSIIYSLNEKV